MNGPVYPPDPLPASNIIGEFELGVGQAGDIPPFRVWTTIISQYANSPRLTQLIENLDAALDQTKNTNDFFDLVWDVVTAQGYGLDVWGRIVGVSRTLHIPAGSEFGFEEAASLNAVGFNQAPFYTGVIATNNYVLSDLDFRTLILAKAFANICDDSIPSLNSLLLGLFPGQGDCYVTDGENMTMTYTFTFPLTQIQLAIVQQSGVLPKPVGVAATVNII